MGSSKVGPLVFRRVTIHPGKYEGYVWSSVKLVLQCRHGVWHRAARRCEALPKSPSERVKYRFKGYVIFWLVKDSRTKIAAIQRVIQTACFIGSW